MKNILKIIRISKPLHKLVFILSGLIVLNALSELISPIISKFVIDEIVKQVSNQGGNLNTLYFYIGLGFALNLVSVGITAISERLGDHVAGRLRQFLTETFYHKIFTLPQSYFDSEISGKIVNQLNRGIQSIQEFANASSNFILPTFLQSIFTIVVLLYYDLWIALFITALFPIYILISNYSAKKWGEEEVKKNKLEDINRGRITEVIGNIKVVKSFTTELKELAFTAKKLTQINQIYARQSRVFHIYDFLRNLSLLVVLLAAYAILFYRAFQGSLTIGEMVLIMSLIQQARRPLFAMSFILTRLQSAESGSKEFFEILDLPSTETLPTNQNLPVFSKPTLEFRTVSFEYEADQQVLKQVSFKIKPDESIALVGHSGAGKTTLINLILKFYDPTSGNILIKNKNYKGLSHSEVRNQIALVFQDNELFSSTIKANVAYGTKATDEQVTKALKQANAYEFVKKLPKGMYSQVGERGVKLSGGQKQRIQIARAILKNAPILILDEATSHLDSKAEKVVQDALETLMKNRMVIIIAHRFSTIQDVDRVFVLDNGTIVDSGTPKELSKRKGIYSDLLRYQIEGNKKLLESFELY